MFVFGRRKSEPKDVRVNYTAPSFSLIRGEYIEAWSKAEAKDASLHFRDSVVIVHPGYNLLTSPREWAGLLSTAHYLVVACREGDEAVEAFRKEVDKLVFSPMRHPVSGISLVYSEEEADSILSRFPEKSVVTLDNTGEVDL